MLLRPRILTAASTILPLALAALVGTAATRESLPLRDGRPTSFLVGGWNVAGAYDHPEWLVRIDEAGFDYVQNLAHHFDPMYGRGLVRSLDSLRAARPGFGLRAILYASRDDETTAAFSGLADPTEDALGRVARTLGSGGGFGGPSVLGYGLWDEPCTRGEIDRLGRVARFLRLSAPSADRLVFANLNPIADVERGSCYEQDFGRDRSRGGAYAAYLDSYLSQFDRLPSPAPVLSFDHYPFQESGRPRSDYPENLSIASRRALAYGRPGVRVPLWVVIQVGTHRPKGRPHAKLPRFAHTRWQAWQALAYGAKGVSYWSIFPVGRPEGPRFDFGGWDEQGRAGPNVAGLRGLNRELHALGPTIMQLDAVATYAGDPGRADGLVPDPASDVAAFHRPLRRASAGEGLGDLLVGLLRQQGTNDDYLLVVNNSLVHARTFRLDLAARADTIERIDRRTGRRVRVATATSQLEVARLAPVTGELFRLGDGMLEPIPGVLEVREDHSVRFYRTADGVLAVDSRTGWRRRVQQAGGKSVPGLTVTSAGVFSRAR